MTVVTLDKRFLSATRNRTLAFGHKRCGRHTLATTELLVLYPIVHAVYLKNSSTFRPKFITILFAYAYKTQDKYYMSIYVAAPIYSLEQTVCEHCPDQPVLLELLNLGLKLNCLCPPIPHLGHISANRALLICN